MGNEWKDAIEDALATWFATILPGETAREALNRLICMEIKVALDPAVSSDAAALIERGRELERQDQQRCYAASK